MKDISFFPNINPKKAKDIFSVLLPEFKYVKDGVTMTLDYDDQDSSSYSLIDKEGFWNPDDYGLELKWEITCGDGSALYGAYNYETACACDDALIGIALSWYSQDSKRRNTIPMGEIRNTNDMQNVVCLYSFEKSQLRGKVGFSLILYLKCPGCPQEDETHFANEQGYVLGTIDEFSIILDGNGSYFTISEVSMPGEPLWKVEYDIDDPTNDSFSDCVSIILNSSHPQYKYIRRNDPQFNIQLLIEIMSNSIATVIETVRSVDKDFDCINNPEEGSVAQALLYFKNVLEWDFTNPITISNSIRKYLEKNIDEL